MLALALGVVGLLAYTYIGSYWWRRFAWELKQDWINTRTEALVLGLMKALVWPVVLVWRAATGADEFMLAPPAIREREKRAALEARIAELERELGIGRRS